MTRTPLVMIAAGASLLAGLLAGCADTGGGGAPDAPQDAADTFLRAAADDGLVVDEACVQDLADQLSEPDARAVVEAGPGGTPEDLTDQGVDVVDRLLTCAEPGSLAELIVTDLEDLGSDVDDDCVRDVIAGLDLDALFRDGAGDDALFGAVVPCVE